MQANQILIVDDDNDVQLALEHVFATAGYVVATARDGVEAINVLDPQSPPCAVLVDLLMPGIIGNELLEYMRDEPVLARIPVAIISGSPQLAPAGYTVFAKPLDARTLLAFIGSLQTLAVTGEPDPPPPAM